jgi:hypothetical protein
MIDLTAAADARVPYIVAERLASQGLAVFPVRARQPLTARGVYRSTQQPMSLRMRAAIEALPFEVPKLSATAIATMDGKTFAEALERCIERSTSPVPRLNGPVEPLPLEELKRPMSRYRRF